MAARDYTVSLEIWAAWATTEEPATSRPWALDRLLIFSGLSFFTHEMGMIMR